jgi:hypothetical protein
MDLTEPQNPKIMLNNTLAAHVNNTLAAHEDAIF